MCKILDTLKFHQHHHAHIRTHWDRSWWSHQMETFSALLVNCAGNSPVTGEFPHKRQWRGASMFSLICAWINGLVNNREAGDLRRHPAHYDVSVMSFHISMEGNALVIWNQMQLITYLVCAYQQNMIAHWQFPLNTLSPRQNGRYLISDIFKCIFMNENFCILIRISLKFVRKGPIDNTLALVQVMAWR